MGARGCTLKNILLQNTKELQESVMRIRMLPISFAFNRFPRLVHDLAMKTGKEMCNDKMPEMGKMHKGKKGGACGAHMNQKDKKAKKGMKGGKK